MKPAQRERLSGTHNNFKAEWLKDADLKSWLQKGTGNENFVIISDSRSPSQMQTNPSEM